MDDSWFQEKNQFKKDQKYPLAKAPQKKERKLTLTRLNRLKVSLFYSVTCFY